MRPETLGERSTVYTSCVYEVSFYCMCCYNTACTVNTAYAVTVLNTACAVTVLNTACTVTATEYCMYCYSTEYCI